MSAAPERDDAPLGWMCPVCKIGSSEAFRCGGPHNSEYTFVDAVPVGDVARLVADLDAAERGTVIPDEWLDAEGQIRGHDINEPQESIERLAYVLASLDDLEDEVPPEKRSVAIEALLLARALQTRLVAAEKVVEAAQAFIDTMATHHSSIAGKEVVSGFTKYSGDAARELAAALEARVDS